MLSHDVPVSTEVLEMTRPVSNPSRAVTYGNRMFVVQALITASVRDVEVSAKRGIGAEAEAVVTVLSGAKLRFTVAVPKAGKFEPVLAV